MKSYTDIPGWFDEEWLYDRMIGRAPNEAIFVEVGCWLGRSTAYCARRIHDSGKSILFYAVDTWEGSPNEPALMEAVAQAGGSVFEMFRSNMEEAGVIESITPVKMPSVAAANLFEDRTLNFVFIDADHTTEAVKADIAAWRPKIKSGGTLAGHDWNTYGSVQQAVTSMLGSDFTVEGNCWIHRSAD